MPDKPKDSLIQQIVDGVSRIAGGPGLWDVLTKRLLYDEDVEHHPEGERHGSVENVIKAVGPKFGTLFSEDMPYLEQYFHPQRDVLPRTNPAPGRPGTLPYREPAYTTNNAWFPGKEAANTEGLGRYAIVNPKTGEMRPRQLNIPFSEEPGEFDHVFDKWDFNTSYGMLKDKMGGRSKAGSVASELAKEILKRSGEPFAVYGPQVRDIKE